MISYIDLSPIKLEKKFKSIATKETHVEVLNPTQGENPPQQ